MRIGEIDLCPSEQLQGSRLHCRWIYLVNSTDEFVRTKAPIYLQLRAARTLGYESYMVTRIECFVTAVHVSSDKRRGSSRSFLKQR